MVLALGLELGQVLALVLEQVRVQELALEQVRVRVRVRVLHSWLQSIQSTI